MKIGAHVPNEHHFSDTFQVMSEYRIRAAQVFLTSGRSPYPSKEYKLPAVYKPIHDLIWTNDYHIYVHAYFSILMRTEMGKRDFSYIKEHLKTASRLGLKGMVIHTAGRTFLSDGTEKKEISVGCVVGSIKQIIQELGSEWSKETQLLIETTAGSKGNSRYGNIDELNRVCSEVDDPRVRICVDTAHCFADGISPEMLLSKNWKYIGLVHFNNPDTKVKLGSHLDRHSGPLTGGSIEGSEIRKLAERIAERDLDVIFERHSLDSVYTDIRKFFPNMENVQEVIS